MVHLVKKEIKGKIYLYLEQRARINGKSKRIWQKYLGAEEKIKVQTALLVEPRLEVSTFDFGLPIVLMTLAQRLDLVHIINECTQKRQQGLSVGDYVLIATLNRCIQPRSKNQLRKWFYSTYLQTLFPKIETYLDSMAYTNHFQYLTEAAIEAIETQINAKLLTTFQVKMDELFYDPTNYATYINPKTQTLPRHGHSKEGRQILNLVSLSVFCTSDGGIPIMHRTYAGNIHDAAHFKTEYPRFLARLHALGLSPSHVTLVFDKGNISDEVFQEIDTSGIHWVASVRPSSHKDLQKLGPTDFPMYTLPNGKTLGILEVQRELHGRDCRLLVTYNPRRAHWAGQNLRKKLETKLAQIQEWFRERLNVKKWRSAEAVEQKIRAIIHTKAHFQFITYHVTGEFGQVNYTVTLNEDAIQAHLKTLGKSFVMTNQARMSPLDLIWLYRQQYTVEQAFKYLKNPNILRITPIYHWKDECIRGHNLTCVLGLLLLTLLHREVQRVFPELSLPRTIELLSEIRISHINFSGSRKVIKKLEKIAPAAKKLADFFELDQLI
jgi:transposase